MKPRGQEGGGVERVTIFCQILHSKKINPSQITLPGKGKERKDDDIWYSLE